MFEPYPDEDYNRYGMIQGTGQQTKGSPYLDQPQDTDPFGPFKHTDNHPGLPKNLLAALQAGKGLSQPLTRDAIIAAYQQGFNRTPSEDEIQVHLRNPYGYSGFLSAMRDSQENRGLESPTLTSPGPANMGTEPVAGPKETIKAPSGKAGSVGLRGNENFGSLGGYDETKFNDPAVQTLKYRVGRVISRYAPSIDGLKSAMADEDWKNDPILSKATYDGGDKLDFGGAGAEADGSGTAVNLSDVIEALDKTTGVGKRWAWQDQNYAGDVGGGNRGTMAPTNNYSIGLDSNFMRALMSPEQQQGSVSIEQILQALLGGGAQNGDYSFLFNK